jgi:hypothetical protein
MTGWTEEGLIRSWRALAKQASDENWRYVHLAKIGQVSIEAGCHFPLGREALIVCFPGKWPIDPARLPEGKGFDVTRIDTEAQFAGTTSVALVRRPEGSPDIFAVMAVDTLRALGHVSNSGVQDVLATFLERVKEWQNFMARTQRPLSSDAQIGLFGELYLLEKLAKTKLGVGALDCWHGPLRAAQDFRVNGGAVEVKSTVRSGSFLARINSIEQLDGEESPFYLCGLRFEEKPDGTSLADLVANLRMEFQAAGVQRGFDALLMVMGYIDDHDHLYDRPMILKEAKAFRVEEGMPRLTRAGVPSAIRSASYVLDLDAIENSSSGLSDMIIAFGLNEK